MKNAFMRGEFARCHSSPRDRRRVGESACAELLHALSTMLNPSRPPRSHAELVAQLHVAVEVLWRAAVRGQADRVEFIEPGAAYDAEDPQCVVDHRRVG